MHRGEKSSEHTSGWRIGTQPASFSYSSIASTILVVMFAKHCGKREDVLGKQTVEEEKSTCQKPQMKDGQYHAEDHNITSD